MPKEPLLPVYAKHINTIFRAPLAEGATLTFKLLEVQNRTGPPGFESFSLLFQAANDTPIRQQTYRIEHDVIDASDMFLVPISQDQNGIIFEAVFNRKIS
jgi:hypothetical protein